MTREATLNLVFPLCGGIAWLGAAYKIAALRGNRRNHLLYVLIAAIACPATAFLLAAPAIYRTVDRLTGVANLATLLVYSLIALYSVLALVMLLLWHLPAREIWPRARRLLAAYGAVLVVMGTLFALAEVTEERPLDFDAFYGADPIVGTFLLVYTSAFAFGLASMGWQSGHFARHVVDAGTRPWLHRGLRLTAVGSVIALGYCVGKAAYVLTSWFGGHLVPLNDVAILCACLGALLTTLGFTMPSWGPSLSQAGDWTRRLIAYHRLYPLWHRLYLSAPEVALEPPSSRWADLRRLSDLDFRLHRRIIEIRDARIVIAPYVDQEAATIAAGKRRLEIPIAALTEATAIAAAVDRRNDTERHTTPRAGFPEPLAGGVTEELAWLLQVARALRYVKKPSPDHVAAAGT